MVCTRGRSEWPQNYLVHVCYTGRVDQLVLHGTEHLNTVPTNETVEMDTLQLVKLVDTSACHC